MFFQRELPSFRRSVHHHAFLVRTTGREALFSESRKGAADGSRETVAYTRLATVPDISFLGLLFFTPRENS